MSEQFSDVLVQEYIEGREFNVGFLGSEAMPLSEISFDRLPEGYWPIVSYAAKWAEGSAEYVGTDPVCPARVDSALADRIIAVAQRAWEVLGGGEGYGRVDLRVAPVARMGAALGWDYDALVGQVVGETLHRARRGAAADSLVRSVTG
jgi:D-alanine-D-alanine ligase-like ATP-grasp enzyme